MTMTKITTPAQLVENFLPKPSKHIVQKRGLRAIWMAMKISQTPKNTRGRLKS